MSGLRLWSQTRLRPATSSKRNATARTARKQNSNKHTERFGCVPGTQIRLLIGTSKMPGVSWSLPAHRSCPRANGTICDSCYASNGCYTYPAVRNAQDVRFRWTVESMRTEQGRQEWVRVMTAAIAQACAALHEPYFRVHDSGDMFNVQYALSWLHIARALPHVKFWIPTRAWQQPSGVLAVFDPLLQVLRQVAALPNVTVRPSALDFGDYAPVVEGLHAGSTASMPDVMRAYQCPAYAQGGHCGTCRTCWDAKDMPVAYQRH